MKSAEPNGHLVISLDFELFWGVRDHRSLKDYGPSIAGVHRVVPRLLDLFEQYQIHCTWASVGMLFSNSKENLLSMSPTLRPTYKNQALDAYAYILNEEIDDLPTMHFAPDLLQKISQCPGQEIGSHSFSHFYSNEAGQNKEQFQADVTAAIKAGRQMDVDLKSFVFPRNQYNPAYLPILEAAGFIAFRGNPSSKFYQKEHRPLWVKRNRAVRFANRYLNLTGSHSFDAPNATTGRIKNIPASLFLPPIKPYDLILNRYKFKRLEGAMKEAAEERRNFHLWWHPHNMSIPFEESFLFLENLLKSFSLLRDRFGFISKNMYELATHP